MFNVSSKRIGRNQIYDPSILTKLIYLHVCILFQIRSLIQLGESFGVKVTIERGKLPSAISIQGHKLDVYKADSKIKGMLFKIKSESMEHGKA